MTRVIVGLGPVGAIFANLLAKAGLSVAVVERVADIYDKPRAITLDHEALRVLQAIGLGDFMEQAIAPHNGSHYLGVDGEIIKIFDPMPPPFPLGWIPNVTFVQPDLEQALRDKLADDPHVDIFLAATGVAAATGRRRGDADRAARVRRGVVDPARAIWSAATAPTALSASNSVSAWTILPSMNGGWWWTR